MAEVEDIINPRGGRFRRNGRFIVLAVIVALLFGLLSLRGVASFYTDYLWFDALNRASVWRQVLGAKIVLTLIFGAFFFVLMWVNLLISDRSAPTHRPPGPEEELIARYHTAIGGRYFLVRTVVSLLFTMVASAGVPSQWEEWLLFVNRKEFGISDPQFGADIGFYVFQLPFLSYVVGWAFAAFVIMLIVTALSHYLNGSVRISVIGGERAKPIVKVHLSAILAVLAVIKALDYWLARYELTTSTRGVLDGAFYTDVNAQLPALYLLIAISLCAVVLLVVNLWRRGWTLPVLAVGLWAFVAIVVGGIYPAFVQRFQVDPNETAREADFADRNIEATRHAFGLEDMTVNPFDYSEVLTPDQIRANAVTVQNARILDPVTVHPTFERFQAERGFYRFLGEDALPGTEALEPTLDTDRYVVDGELRQVVLGARELAGEDTANWERRHVRVTHGYGLAMASANATTDEGRPDFLVSTITNDVDDSLDLDFGVPQIYHGEDMGGYSLVGTTVDEVDYVANDGGDVLGNYSGSAGVKLGGIVRQLAFALRFGQIEPLISNFINNDTRVIYVRDVRDRVEKLAPFLQFDSDVYPVIFDERIHYVIDAYTTTDRYPYSQRSENDRLQRGGLAGPRFNYVRNSVKAVVDAYDGDVSFYVMPVEDPIIEAWRSAFPSLFSDFSEMPDELKDHLRYPQDLFRVQTNMYSTYQIENPVSLLVGTERWAVAQDPGRSVSAGGTLESSVDEQGIVTVREQRVSPYYTLLQLPGEDDPSFVTLRSFVPYDENDDRKELEAFMVGETHPDGSSRLVTYELTSSTAPGPVLVASGIAQTEEITARLTLLDQAGSQVDFSDLVMLPIDNSILWVRSLYVSAEGTSVPNLEFVIAAIVGETQQIGLGRNLNEALQQLFPGEDFSDIVGEALGDVSGADLAEDDGDGDAGDPDRPATADPDETPAPADTRAPDDTPAPDVESPETLVELLTELDRQFRLSQEALAADPPQRSAWAAAQDRIDELLAQFRSLATGG
ncbi:MAG: UPF0182 family protein [Acidimicrobiaceae bacterium]|nr:UPF0182 family protein [Acidimicrobiaceae bacterium]MYA74775.1 UPF0182 family protein [Acidimicrobiaceae bacterium]MYD06756.1 UPF0182 family protein [Acidimicrobiaceae bacterium]MYG54384.1 UPF0182 family protein [Acidimicrobiaceae bacterium]MYI58976.1 UPF0182 family protein [Acidimicrobiaceae bacterium]